MPGRIIMELKRLGVANPVFMLDEIDKIGQDFKGDPASVLLEILDPEQNRNFVDYYLDVPFDLSSVMFICTANLVDRLPMPLLDRLEIIEFNGYTLEEKKWIASKYLVPRQLEANGLRNESTEFSPEAITSIINNFTQEAGLRNLEREIANICRKVARSTLEANETHAVTVTSEKVAQYLGPPKFRHEKAEEIYQVGTTTGLVWTEFGGEIITVESTKMKGSQQLILTGSLGNILRESAQTALSYIRSNAEKYSLDPDFFRSIDIHIHIPAAAVPKDGPSAGITILMSLLSLLTGIPARRTVALSGEITLNGKLLPVSGIREKVLAAQRAGVETVVFPADNTAEISLLSEDLKKGLNVTTAHHVSELETLVLSKSTT
jgi:ATP-dependent Lon protease